MVRQWFAVVLIITFGLTLCSCSEQPPELPVDLPIAAPPVVEEPIAEEPQAVEEPQEEIPEYPTEIFEGVSYTLLEINPDYISAGKYATPKTGYHFVTVKLQYQNQTDAPKEVSSLLMLSVLDGEGNEYPITITVSDLPQTLDGIVAPGGVLEGYAAFEVPMTAEHLNLRIAPNLFSDEVVQFPLF